MSATPGYIDQDPNALRLSMLEGIPDRGQFSCLKRGTFSDGTGIDVDATVIGASHLVVFAAGDFAFSEVFACTGITEAASVPLSRLTGSVMPRLDGFSYRFDVRRIAWRDPEPAALQGLIQVAQEGRCELGIVQEFPACPGSLVTPKTVIVGHAHENGRGVEIQTAHAYPGKGLVLSRSVFIRKEL